MVSPRWLDVFLGTVAAGLLAWLLVLFTWTAEPDLPLAGVVGPAVPRPGREPLPPEVLDTAPADGRLRRDLARVMRAQWGRTADGTPVARSAEELGVWPSPGVTLSVRGDSAGWNASAYHAAAKRQCAVVVGGTESPFGGLEDGVVGCRTLEDESGAWWDSTGANRTKVWAGGRSRRVGTGADPNIDRLRRMRAAVEGELVSLRDGWARVPYPDWRMDGSTRNPFGSVVLSDVIAGDLDRDGRWEAVVIVWLNGGGTGFFYSIGVVRPDRSGMRLGWSVGLGDRTRILGLRNLLGTITLDAVVHGPGDGRCCPTDTVQFLLGIRGDSLALLDDEAPTLWHAAATSRPLARPHSVQSLLDASTSLLHGSRRVPVKAARTTVDPG